VSDYFLAINDVKLGGVLTFEPCIVSPVRRCLLGALSKARVECFIGDNFFVGALTYPDDIVLLASMASTLRSMLAICDQYCLKYFITVIVASSVLILYYAPN
jgi:hypothetical protein